MNNLQLDQLVQSVYFVCVLTHESCSKAFKNGFGEDGDSCVGDQILSIGDFFDVGAQYCHRH